MPRLESGRAGNDPEPAGEGGAGGWRPRRRAEGTRTEQGLGPTSGWLAVLPLAIWGPGLMVMLADTDVGSLVTAAQSGAEFRYALVLPLVVLIPVLYLIQEMTVRLGILTGRGHGALIREHFGARWATLSATTLMVSALGALVTEFAGVAGVGQMFGVPRLVTVPVAAAFLLGIVSTGSYRRYERIGIAVGLAELVFIPAMVLAHPDPGAALRGLTQLPLGNSSFLFLVAANLGAVIMPWMIFYQQGAVIDRGLKPAAIHRERRETAVGAVLTQLVMIAVVVALAATVGTRHPGATLVTVGQITGALRPFFGSTLARVLLGVGILGAGLVAALVASLAGAWGISEVFGWQHSLNRRPGRATAPFYLTYFLAIAGGATLVLTRVDLISLAVHIEVLNALLLPVVLGFLLALEARALPVGQRRTGWRRWAVVLICAVVVAVGLTAIPAATGLR